MLKKWMRTASLVFTVFASALLFSCSTEVEVPLEVKTTLDNAPVSGAKVFVDGKEAGSTGPDGSFSKKLKRKPGVEVKLGVEKKAPGYRIEPWKDSFVIKAPDKGKSSEPYSFDVVLKATKYFIVAATDKGTPIEGAVVKVRGKEAGTTGPDGTYTYEFTKLKGKVKVEVRKDGFGRWRKTVKVGPGDTVAAALFRSISLSIKAVTELYGETEPLPGVSVIIGGKRKGKTNKSGRFTYKYKGTPGKKLKVKLSLKGYIPESWSTSIKMDNAPALERYFYPLSPKPIRVGIYGYVSNTPDDPLESARTRMEEALGNRLFSYLSFKQVPKDNLEKRMKKSKLDIETMTTKGWRKSRLSRSLDMIILGSVLKDDRGLTFETGVYTSGGRLLFSQINTVKKEKHIKKVAKKISAAIIEKFPFEGTVVEVDGKRFKVNLGKADYGLKRKMEFALLSPVVDRSGRVKSHKDVGTLTIRKTGSDYSFAEILDLEDGHKVKVGDKVARRITSEEEQRGAKTSFNLLVKRGGDSDSTPLGLVNIYLNGNWVGTTDSSGKAQVSARLKKRHDLILYRHGFERAAEEVYLKKDAEVKSFSLSVNNSLFKVESNPSAATVFVDGNIIGNTPLRDGEQVNFGFHTVRLSTGGNYRDWEEVVEFNSRVVDRTGTNRITLFKDFARLGKNAESRGNFDDAIKAYKSAGRSHPDYSILRHRLGALYMDERQDYDSAIGEFEAVLALPENKELIYKQYAVAYTNLGHAYYEKGNLLIKTDREGAAKNFGQAIKNLEVAKQNTRFFPTELYDEATHDTYYYAAISLHKLYLVTKKSSLLDKADLAWRKYFDFFPKKLEADDNFMQIRDSARKHWTQIQDLM